MLRAMYVPAHFNPTMPRSVTLLGSGRAANLITRDRRRAARDDAAAGLRRPGRRPGSRAMGCTARARGPEQRASGRRPRSARRWSSSRGPDAYISPAWYATKREHGRVVPTWNYITVARPRPAGHPRRPGLGRGERPAPDASTTRRRAPSRGRSMTRPAPYIEGQLQAIVGVEILIDRVEGKWKLSQNRSDADIAGTIEGLEAPGEDGVSAAMRDAEARATATADRQSNVDSWRTAVPSREAVEALVDAVEHEVSGHRCRSIGSRPDRSRSRSRGTSRRGIPTDVRALQQFAPRPRGAAARGPWPVGAGVAPRPSPARWVASNAVSRDRHAADASTTVSPPPPAIARIRASASGSSARTTWVAPSSHRQVELGVDDVDGDDRMASGEARAHHGAEADAAEPEDDGRGPGPRRRRVDEGSDTGQDRAAEDRGEGEVGVRVDPDQRRLRARPRGRRMPRRRDGG